MSLRIFKNKADGTSRLCFESEAEAKLGEDWEDRWDKLPPNPTVIMSSYQYMVDGAYLDSIHSIEELNTILNSEAELDRLHKEMDEARKNS